MLACFPLGTDKARLVIVAVDLWSKGLPPEAMERSIFTSSEMIANASFGLYITIHN